MNKKVRWFALVKIYLSDEDAYSTYSTENCSITECFMKLGCKILQDNILIKYMQTGHAMTLPEAVEAFKSEYGEVLAIWETTTDPSTISLLQNYK